jgi:endogenous inhibitor of DNA gyrase (YacG/DUF329 family)
VDLGRWFTGAYQVPVQPEEDEDGPSGTTLDHPPRDR